MALPLYLAMTAAEFAACKEYPKNLGWMACHFSAYGAGLSNLPPKLPEGAMLILNDRTPIAGHDAALIARQFAEVLQFQEAACVLLDFQRPGSEETAAVAQAILASLPCPVAVSEPYAKDLACPVFLPPVPPDEPIDQYLAPWKGREIWLEAALDSLCISVTQSGSTTKTIAHASDAGHPDEALCCHCRVEVHNNCARFHLQRTLEDLDKLLGKAAALGVSTAVGLYQELGK